MSAGHIIKFPAGRQPRRRLAVDGFEHLARLLHLVVCFTGASRADSLPLAELEARVDDILRRMDALRANPNPAAISQARALADQAAAMAADRCPQFADQAQKQIQIIFGKLLTAPAMPPPAMPIRLADRRQLIRESRAYESTAGPPPDPKTPNAPDLEPGARSLLNSVDNGIQPENLTRRNSEISENAPLVAEVIATADPADLEFIRQTNRLWQLGPRQLAEFALAYTMRTATRTQLETELNHFLEQGEDA